MPRRDFLKGLSKLLGLAAPPANPFDANAVRIDWSGRKLGYIPHSLNQATARMLDAGRHLQARIAGLENASNPWRRREVEVFLLA